MINNYSGGAQTRVQPLGSFGGKLAAGQTEGYYRAKAAESVAGLQLAAQVAPTGADLLVELVQNGVDTGKVATLAAGAKTQETIFGSPLAVAIGDVLRYKPTQVGSTNAGANLAVGAIVQPA